MVLAIALAVAGALVVVLAPPLRRMHVAIVIAFPWLTLGFLSDLPALASSSRITLLVPIGLVAASALRYPTGRIRLPVGSYAYVLVAALSIPFVASATNLGFVLGIQVLWLALAIAATLVVSTVRSEADVERLILAICYGSLATIAVGLAAFAVEGMDALRGGRLEPFGSNPNHYAVALALGTPLLLWASMTLARRRYLFLAGGLLGVVFAILSGSRGVILAVGIGLVPIVVDLLRRRVSAIALTLSVAASAWILSVSSNITAVDRLGSLTSGRSEIATDYLDGLSDRLLSGLLFTHGRSSLPATEFGWTAHNSFLHWLYLGGLLLTIPLVIACGATVVAAFRLVRTNSALLPPGLASVLLFSFLGTYLLSVSNGMLLYPTNSWAFGHLLLSVLTMSLAYGRLRSGTRAPDDSSFLVAG